MRSTSVDHRAARQRPLSGRFLGALAVVLLSSFTLWFVSRSVACPFCEALPATLSEEIAASRLAAIATVIQLPESDPDTDTDSGSETNTDLPAPMVVRIDRVLRGADTLQVGREMTLIARSRPAVGTQCLVSGFEDAPDAWATPTPLSGEAVLYLSAIEQLPEKGIERLSFFLPTLFSLDPLLADDAYNEFARTDLETILKLGEKLDRELIRRELEQAEPANHRRGLMWTLLAACGNEQDQQFARQVLEQARTGERQERGLDAVFSCYLTLGGEVALQEIETVWLRDPKSSYSETYSAVQAIRIHGEELEQLPRTRLTQALRLVLSRPELADLVIPDLARWKDWSCLPELRKLVETMDNDTEFLAAPIVAYLEVCPTAEAQPILDRLTELRPDAVRRARVFASLSDFDEEADEEENDDNDGGG